MVEAESLQGELIALRKGRGAQDPALRNRVGPLLRRIAGISDDMLAAEVRHRLIDCLEMHIRRVPEDLRMAASAAFALDPATAHRFLERRFELAADRLQRESRTVRRWSDKAIAAMAEQMTIDVDDRPAQQARRGWYVDALSTLHRLDGPTVVSYERRRIVAVEAPLERFEMAISLPQPADPRTEPPLVTMDLLCGGVTERLEVVGSQYFRWYVELAEPLPVGGQVDVLARFVFPPGLRTPPYYVFVPHHPCRRFRTVIRFPPGVPPPGLRRLDGAPGQVLADDAPIGEPIGPNRLGELALGFDDLREGLAYGARWTPQPR
ncbi:hypothetical protein [Dactylosporangium sp. CA-139066]|uniref:hypothetical protein n=1 Tax=Dactylosporangium sp. CA-139066 TaxID=3239930 RepID=UPI003D8E71C8